MSAADGGPARQEWPTGPWLQEYEAFDRRYRSVVLEYLRSLDGTVPYLDDAVQDAMEIVAARWGTVRDYDKPQAYLFKVARQRWLKHRRYRGNCCAALPDDFDGAPTPSAAHREGDHAPRIDGIHHALALLRPLPTRQREVAFLCLVADFDEQAVAEVLGISVGAVKQHRSRALQRLRQDTFAHASTRDRKDPEEGNHGR